MQVSVLIEVDQSVMDREIEAETRKIETGIVEGVKEILSLVEGIQIKAYTATANPPLPPGSFYDRTFTLQSASRTQMTSERLPKIEGEWFVDLMIAPYGPKVLGRRAQQSPVHRNRWKSEQEVEAKAQKEAQQIMEKHVK